jgi:DNA repair protein SbcC/Rad50
MSRIDRLESAIVILNTITLHNFMSYGDASLDLSPCDVACLSGSNGAGKSAILDGVTWVLWECARSGSDELIRAGEQEMWVDLTFELEGALYRVRRSRQRTSARGGARTSSRGTLEFQVCQNSAGSNGSGGLPEGRLGKGKAARTEPACIADNNGGNGKNQTVEWRSLTAANMRDTQIRICQVLHMDYDTFINSVYLRQGRADEFTTRPPSERKQVLAEILRLSYFDKLQELAKDEARQRKAQADALQSNLGDSETTASDLATTGQQLRSITTRLEERRHQRNDLTMQLRRLQDDVSEATALQMQIGPTTERLVELEQDINSLQESRDRLQTRLAELESLLSAVNDAETLSARFKELRSRVEHLDGISLERQELDTRRLELKSQVANQRGRMEVDLEHRQSQMQALQKTKEKLESQLSSSDKLNDEYEQYKKLLQQESEMAQRQEAFAQLSSRCEQLHTTIVESRFYLEAQTEQKQLSLNDLNVLIQSRDTMDKETAQLQSAQKLLDTAEVEFEHVEQQGLKLKQDIDAADVEISQLRKQQSDNDHKCQELHDAKSLSMCPLCAAPIVDRAAVLTRYKNLHEQIDGQIDELETTKVNLEKKRNDMRQRYIELKRQLDGRKALDVRIGEFNARQAALQRADENHARLTAELAESREKLEKQTYAQVERESLIALKTELHKLDFDPMIYASLQAQIRALRHIDVRHQQQRRDQSDLAQVIKEIPPLAERILHLQETLSKDAYAPAERLEIGKLEEQLTHYPYDRAEHQALKQELAKLLPIIDRLRDVERALVEKPQLADEIVSAEQKLAIKREQQKQLQQSISAWTAKIENLASSVQRKASLENELAEAEQAFQELDHQTIVLQERIQQLEQQLQVLEQKQQQLTTLLAEINDYTLLAEAFGKKGIQAVIIENAVPEIESEANRILSRLSDNQMHLALVTQQRTKQGHLNETLEIVIADQMGTRAYELYSGGEAFKINFSIRLALSRLLARRAGAKLQTLIIDEGFGSQDEASRARLVNAINAIRIDFARILIVTHIAEIKDMFPVQIQIQKDNGLSSINILHAF